MDIDEPEDVDVCVLGAGPHGLTAAIHLRHADPDLNVIVVDPAGQWLTTWHEQFARAEIDTLRSPAVHHPSPDPGSFARFVGERGLRRSGLPYDPPTTEAFTVFCRALVDEFGLEDPRQSRVDAISSDGRRARVQVGSHTVSAGHVIVATNPHRRVIPDWTWSLLGQGRRLVEHAFDVDLRTVSDLSGEVVAVVGGGLTAAHVACGAAARGAKVHLLTRRPLRIRGFDTEPGWLGPKYLDAYFAEPDAVRRIETARSARGGGSIPEWMSERLTSHAVRGRIEHRESVDVRFCEVDDSGAARLHLDDESSVAADRVWLATGTVPDIGAARFLGSVLEDVPTHDGLPLVGERLRLGPHPVYVMGRLATVALGPAAGNLWGGQRAARRIAGAITGVDFDDATGASSLRVTRRP